MCEGAILRFARHLRGHVQHGHFEGIERFTEILQKSAECMKPAEGTSSVEKCKENGVLKKLEEVGGNERIIAQRKDVGTHRRCLTRPRKSRVVSESGGSIW